ncbi:MAG: PDZ domain-containing protein, partial [Patescibacteria group bacterium]
MVRWLGTGLVISVFIVAAIVGICSLIENHVPKNSQNNEQASQAQESKSEELKKKEDTKEDTYVGIGIILTGIVVKTNIYIVRVFPDTPADKAGLRLGDQILK